MEWQWIKLLYNVIFIAVMLKMAWRYHRERDFDTTPFLELSLRPPRPQR